MLRLPAARHRSLIAKQRTTPLFVIAHDQRRCCIIDNQLVVELKATENLAPVHVAQVLSYLKLKRLRRGLLVNFNVAELRQGIKRVINNA